MKIFYDHQAFSLQKYGGVSRIFAELLKGINSSADQAHLSAVFSNNEHLKEANIPVRGFFPGSKFPFKQKFLSLSNEVYNAFELSTRQYSIYHPTYYNSSLIRFCKKKVPIVATFHDMIHEKFADDFPELAKDSSVIKNKRILAKKADHIIAVSENTKADLIDIYGLSEKKITTVYLGSSIQHNPDTTSQHPKFRYLLFVGNRGGYKNFIPFLQAAAPVLVKNNLHVICAGGKQFDRQESALIRSLKLDNLVSQEAIDDIRLATLYSNAFAFVFPSLYEGFGIPILESFSCECPCILANQGSLPEIARDAALYIDPTDPVSIQSSIQLLVNNPARRLDLIKKGTERLREFSWRKHVQQTLEVYRQLAG